MVNPLVSNNPECLKADPKAAYRQAGVDVDAGQQAVAIAQQAAKKTFTGRLPLLSGVGGFSAAFTLPTGFQEPVLLAGCDGVGTKLLLAHQLDCFDTVGIDLVAMNANDVLANGGQPLAFMDYVATGKLSPQQFSQLLNGIAEGCQAAGCQLIGGETAEMPGLYAPGHVDVAGFCLGIAEKAELYPRLNQLQPGDVVIGLASSGCHSNGYSLVRKLIADHNVDLSAVLPGSKENLTIGEALLAPTQIYVQPVHQVLEIFPNAVRSMAHITGGGFSENLPRALPDTMAVCLTPWPLNPLYQWLSELGSLDWETLTHTFNAGFGFCLVVEAASAQGVLEHFTKLDETLVPQIIGEVVAKTSEQPTVAWVNA